MHQFPKCGITTIDGVIYSHAHMDAIGGADDLRDVQGSVHALKDELGHHVGYKCEAPMPVYADPKVNIFYAYLLDNCKQQLPINILQTRDRLIVFYRVVLHKYGLIRNFLLTFICFPHHLFIAY